MNETRTYPNGVPSWVDTEQPDPEAAMHFYRSLFGIRARQHGGVAPPGFEDAIAWVGAVEPGAPPHWHVTFAVQDRDTTAALAGRLGADVLSTDDTRWTRTALVRDPQGAIFTASQFTPRSST